MQILNFVIKISPKNVILSLEPVQFLGFPTQTPLGGRFSPSSPPREALPWTTDALTTSAPLFHSPYLQRLKLFLFALCAIMQSYCSVKCLDGDVRRNSFRLAFSTTTRFPTSSVVYFIELAIMLPLSRCALSSTYLFPYRSARFRISAMLSL